MRNSCGQKSILQFLHEPFISYLLEVFAEVAAVVVAVELAVVVVAGVAGVVPVAVAVASCTSWESSCQVGQQLGTVHP